MSEQTLNRARRDVRASRNGLRLAHRPTRRETSAEFAAALLARYADRQMGPAGLDLVLLRTRAPAAGQHIVNRLAVQVQPRLQLLLRAGSPPGSPGVATVPVPALQTLVRPLTRLLRERIETQTTVERLLARQVRAEGPASASGVPTSLAQAAPALPAMATLARGRPPVPPVPAIPRVIRRSAPPPVAQPEARGLGQAAPSFQDRAWPDSQRRAGAAQPGFSSPADLDRLTEEVVRAIDRRIVAHRERLGRR